jgi:L-lactate dehydrogenase complex protein LldG
MSEREKILGRIREALRISAPRPGRPHNGAASPLSKPQLAARHAKDLLPETGKSLAENLAMFQIRATELKVDFRLVADRNELTKVLIDLRDKEQWKKIGVHAGALTDHACECLTLPVCRTDNGYQPRDLEQCSVGITECDALVAQTGSVLVTARSAGGRALSALPPHHVVLAKREQLVADLPDALALLKSKYGSDYPSFISFITGPSRTGDIERILVLGAHGPRQLTILCL